MVAVDRTALDFRNIFTNLDFNKKSVFRKYERLINIIKKKGNLLSSVLFNRTCEKLKAAPTLRK